MNPNILRPRGNQEPHPHGTSVRYPENRGHIQFAEEFTGDGTFIDLATHPYTMPGTDKTSSPMAIFDYENATVYYIEGEYFEATRGGSRLKPINLEDPSQMISGTIGVASNGEGKLRKVTIATEVIDADQKESRAHKSKFRNARPERKDPFTNVERMKAEAMLRQSRQLSTPPPITDGFAGITIPHAVGVYTIVDSAHRYAPKAPPQYDAKNKRWVTEEEWQRYLRAEEETPPELSDSGHPILPGPGLKEKRDAAGNITGYERSSREHRTRLLSSFTKVIGHKLKEMSRSEPMPGMKRAVDAEKAKRKPKSSNKEPFKL